MINSLTASCSGCSDFTFLPVERLSWPIFFLLLTKVTPRRYKSGHYRFSLYPYILTFDAQYSAVQRASLNKPTIKKINICLWMPQSTKDLGCLLLLVRKAYLKSWPPYSGTMFHWPFNFYCIYYLLYLVGNNNRLLSNFHYNVTCSNIFFCCFVWGKSNKEALSWTSLNCKLFVGNWKWIYLLIHFTLFTPCEINM